MNLMNLLKYFSGAANLLHASAAPEPFEFDARTLSITNDIYSPGRLRIQEGAEYAVFEPPADDDLSGMRGSIVVFRNLGAAKVFYFVPEMTAEDVEVKLKTDGSVPAYPGMPPDAVKNYQKHLRYIDQNIIRFMQTGQLQLNIFPIADHLSARSENSLVHQEIGR